MTRAPSRRAASLRAACALFVASFAVAGLPSAAWAWDPFISPNDNVEDGNRAYREGDHPGALTSYDEAARELPAEPGVHLNRGLALLAGENQDEARRAFLEASDPEAPADVRADAYYDLGISFYREGDGHANQEDHENAQRLFREAVDAFRRSLRARPGDRNTAWNLELAQRRLREQEEEQRQQEQQEQEQQEQEQQDQEQQDQEQQQEGSEGDEEQEQDEQGDGQDQDQQNQDQEGQDAEPQDSQEGQDGQNDPQTGDREEDQGSEEQANSGDQQSDQQGADSQQSEQTEGAGGQEQLPEHVERVLDSLANSEENLERQLARQRARRENRRPTMDW